MIDLLKSLIISFYLLKLTLVRMILSIAERHKYILNTLQKEGFIRVIDVAKKLDVTTVTIRKDLKTLEEKGLLYRTHGSASPINPHASDRNVKEKEKERIKEKQLIGISASKLIEENDSIIINSGSTICAFAEQIVPKERLTVVTSSIKATTILSENEAINISQLGGTFRRSSMSVIGSYTLSFLENITCSKVFLGVDGVDLDFGVTTSNIEEAELNKAMMNISLKTIVLCDSSKFGRKGFGKICNLDKIDIIITDEGISPSIQKLIEEQGVEVIIAR
ncbi:transcriptional regulator, DeoR family [Pseudopedobacter saltans DSM 12145]|uniref:Transcriptional regulator, DeoR family n=1 Tax=Pseudopedobacter saltans (strain ATCC 51119 / DSM 12145 / JCM 21818 / CCUG 39354 / LMG 10337 / NBRC 100064 / NCIMB 13643) TaxID=762903 RepID=F0SAR4_PSESL|nr:DeoR/GlpR family DNA-binding transcription regulator [Pseudopedobacter saltans]ADY53685.1 transcriptional regulator, DeoR family [Pseudopedobacter saltans DSM 12145]